MDLKTQIEEFADSFSRIANKSPQSPEVGSLLTDAIYNRIRDKDFASALHLEFLVGQKYLRVNETEAAYDFVYKHLAEAYARIDVESIGLADQAGGRRRIAFIINNGDFLAHVSQLFHLILNRWSSALEISEEVFLLILMRCDQRFTYPWRQLGVETVPFGHSGETLDKQLGNAQEFIKLNQITDVIWVCAPLGLPLFSRMVSGVTWWSMKMHPSMPNVQTRLGGPPNDVEAFHVNGFRWESFVSPFSYYNSSRTPIPFREREHKVAAMCRSELIDTMDFWSLINLALNTDANLIFEYTGNEAVHKKWVAQCRLPESRINFLGWLENPEKHLRRYKALIDPFPLGHGVMGREAIRAEVPLIFSWADDAVDSPIRKEIAKLKDINLNKSLLPGYASEPAFQSAIKDLLHDEHHFDSVVKYCKTHLLEKQSDWHQFLGKVGM